jgi:putative phosphoesterase
MKIALFSDIHANLPALEAMFSDMEKHQPDLMLCLGDLVGYHVWPNEVVHEIRRRNIPCIAGNYDYGIGRSLDECGCAYKSDDEKAMGKVSIAYTNQMTSKESKDYLRSLPQHLRFDFQIAEEAISILLVHGSPRKINEYLFEDRPEESLLRIMEQANTDVLFFGHTHKPFHKVLYSESKSKYLHAVNTGSVGKPKDGNPKGSYVILELNEQSSLQKKDGINPVFHRFEYEVERSALALENSPLPKAYADMLRRGA